MKKYILILALSLVSICGLLYGIDIVWAPLTDLPIPSNSVNGSCIIYVEETPPVEPSIPRSIYYLVHDQASARNRFYRFLIHEPQSWQVLPDLPGSTIGEGADITIQYDRLGYPIGIYAIKGNGHQEVWWYDLNRNYWYPEPIDRLPNAPRYGSRFVYGGTFIDPEGYPRARYYFLVANGSQEFWVWCPVVPVHGRGVRGIYPPPYWEPMQSIPSFAYNGSALTYAQCDNVPGQRAMYAFDRADHYYDYFYRYTIATNTWELMEHHPWSYLGGGASLQSYYLPPNDNLLIAFRGEGDACKGYWTNQDDWVSADDPDVPTIGYGSDMTFGKYADGDPAVYAIFGGNQTTFKWGRVTGAVEPGGEQTIITSPINEPELRILPNITNTKTGVTLLISPDVKELSIYNNSGIRIKSLKCKNLTESFWKPITSGVFFIYAETRDKILKGKLVVTP